MKSIIETISKLKLVPVVKLNNAADAIPLANTLVDAGLPIAEITYRSDAASESIRLISENVPKMIVGAGTIVNLKQAKEALSSGAKFLVSPGFSAEIAQYCADNNVPVFLGATTATEIMALMSYGLKIAKFFPAEQQGGLATIKALSAPFSDMKFMPTGGISMDNISDYLKCDKIIACGGSWMVKTDLIDSGNFAEIGRLTREALQKIASV